MSQHGQGAQDLESLCRVRPAAQPGEASAPCSLGAHCQGQEQDLSKAKACLCEGQKHPPLKLQREDGEDGVNFESIDLLSQQKAKVFVKEDEIAASVKATKNKAPELMEPSKASYQKI